MWWNKEQEKNKERHYLWVLSSEHRGEGILHLHQAKKQGKEVECVHVTEKITIKWQKKISEQH